MADHRLYLLQYLLIDSAGTWAVQNGTQLNNHKLETNWATRFFKYNIPQMIHSSELISNTNTNRTKIKRLSTIQLTQHYLSTKKTEVIFTITDIKHQIHNKF